MKNALIYPIIASLAWALSAPIIQEGHKKIPSRQKLHHILIGLLIGLITGSICGLIVLLINKDKVLINTYTLIVGISTFPLGTGLYYLCGLGIDNRMEIASQFSRIRPFISIILGIFFFHETINKFSLIAIALTTLGLGILFMLTYSHSSRLLPVILGIGTGICWSVGDILTKLGIRAEVSYQMTASSLIIGTLVALIVSVPYLCKTYTLKRDIQQYYIWYALHGILSYGLAYPFFFYSITIIGLTKTALITTAWPFISILLVWINHFIKKEPYHAELSLICASLLITLGSIIEIIDFLK